MSNSLEHFLNKKAYIITNSFKITLQDSIDHGNFLIKPLKAISDIYCLSFHEEATEDAPIS